MFSERFLQLYNDELRYFREAGRQFASSHPQVAQHLGMHIDGVLDPFVERLLECSHAWRRCGIRRFPRSLPSRLSPISLFPSGTARLTCRAGAA